MEPMVVMMDEFVKSFNINARCFFPQKRAGTSGRCLLCLVVEFQPVWNILANAKLEKSEPQFSGWMFETCLSCHQPENLFLYISSHLHLAAQTPQKNTTVKYTYAKILFLKKKNKSKHGGFTNIPSNLSRIGRLIQNTKNLTGSWEYPTIFRRASGLQRIRAAIQCYLLMDTIDTSQQKSRIKTIDTQRGLPIWWLSFNVIWKICERQIGSFPPKYGWNQISKTTIYPVAISWVHFLTSYL